LTNTVTELNLNLVRMHKFHWKAPDNKRPDDLLTEPKLVTLKTCICVA